MYQVSLIPLNLECDHLCTFFFLFAYSHLTEPSNPRYAWGLYSRVEGQCLLVVYLRGPKSGIGRDGGGGDASQNERWALMAKLSRQHITDWMVSDVFCRETCFCLLFLPPESTVYWVGYLEEGEGG
jgi:hypothetical protein